MGEAGMIERNMIKVGDILEWLGDEECVMLFVEQISKSDEFVV
jgi:hypothetical protein